MVKTCGDCIHADVCKEVNGGWFSSKNPAYCKLFKNKDVPNKWISVEEQQPKGEVLAFSSECCEMLIGYVHGDGTVDGWCCESDEETLYGVTHWMPLPEPPKED